MTSWEDDAQRKFEESLLEEYERGYKKGYEDVKAEQKWIRVTEKKAIEWFENRIAVMPESETKEMFCMAISALEFRENYRAFWEEVKAAGMQGKEVEIHHSGRAFKIREVAQ